MIERSPALGLFLGHHEAPLPPIGVSMRYPPWPCLRGQDGTTVTPEQNDDAVVRLLVVQYRRLATLARSAYCCGELFAIPDNYIEYSAYSCNYDNLPHRVGTTEQPSEIQDCSKAAGGVIRTDQRAKSEENKEHTTP